MYLTPLPLVAVLRGITPAEIRSGRRRRSPSNGFAFSRCRSIRPIRSRASRGWHEQFGERCLTGAGTVIKVADVSRASPTPAGGSSSCRTAMSRSCAKPSGCGSCACPAWRRRPKRFAALDAGADGLKMFPAEQLSPAVLKAWRAVLPHGHAGVSGRRHPSRQHGAVLGSRRETDSARARICTSRAPRPNAGARRRPRAMRPAFAALQRER